MRFQPFSKPAAPLVLISSCLLGNKVRYDGQAKRNQPLHLHMLPHLQALAVCPEAMAGMGIPRPPIRLIETRSEIRALGRDDHNVDVTERLRQMGLIQHRAHALLAGAILQSRSPSCGVTSTPHFNEVGTQTHTGPGLFARTLREQRPWLPVIEDTDLDNAMLRTRFLLKSYLCADWLTLRQAHPEAWHLTLDFLRHHDDCIRQLTLTDAEAIQLLFLEGTPVNRQQAQRQTLDLFLVSLAGNYSR
jgi:uncharacterized protein YbbK (DUF523 family)